MYNVVVTAAEKRKKKSGSNSTTADDDEDDYLDNDMKTMDENAQKRIQSILLEFKDHMQKYSSNADDDKPKTGQWKAMNGCGKMRRRRI